MSNKMINISTLSEILTDFVRKWCMIHMLKDFTGFINLNLPCF